jgi:hypothetical protein
MDLLNIITLNDVINTKSSIQDLKVYVLFNFGEVGGIPFVEKNMWMSFYILYSIKGLFLFCAPHIGLNSASRENGARICDMSRVKVEQLALQHLNQILQAYVPLVSFTLCIYSYTEQKLIS